jgi:hypothetical protein
LNGAKELKVEKVVQELNAIEWTLACVILPLAPWREQNNTWKFMMDFPMVPRYQLTINL